MMPLTDLPIFILIFAVLFIGVLAGILISRTNRSVTEKRRRANIRRMRSELSQPDPHLTEIENAESLEDLDRLEGEDT